MFLLICSHDVFLLILLALLVFHQHLKNFTPASEAQGDQSH